MADVIDLGERRRRAKTLNLAEEGGYAVAVGCADGKKRAGIIVPSGHDGLALSPEAARELAIDLIELAAAIEKRHTWLHDEEE